MGFQIKIDGENWTNLEGFNFAFENDVTTGNTWTQGSDATFGMVNVSISDLTLLPRLLEFAALDTERDIVIRSTQTSTSGEFVNYELRLNDAQVQLVTDSVFGMGLSFSYSDIGVTTFSKSLVPSGTFDYDVTNNDTDPTDLPTVPTFVAPVGGITPNQYVMAIDGVLGSLTDKGRVGWFEVVDFSSGLEAAPGSTGFGAQRMQVVVNDQAGLAQLMALAANNKLLSSIRIDSIGSTTASISREFGDVRIEAIEESSDFGFLVDFSFEEFRTTTVQPDLLNPGKSTTVTGGFDAETGTATPTIDTPVPGKGVAAAPPVTFHLAMSGFSGDSTTIGKNGWFDVENMQFDIDASGAGLGFTPLSLQLSSDHGLAPMISRMSGSKSTIERATLVGTDINGNTVYTLDVAGVKISDLVNPGSSGLLLQLDFDRFELSTSGYNASQVLVDAGRFGWDALKQSSISSLSSAVPQSSKGSSEGLAEKYYMTVSGMNGGGTEPGWVRSFELSEFEYAAFRDGTSADFSPVMIRTLTDAGLVAMMRASTTGQEIVGVRIDGVVDVGGVETRINRLELGDVRVVDLQDSSDPGFSAALDYERFTYRTFDPVTGARTSLSGFDRVTDTSFTTTIAVTPSTAAAEVSVDRLLFVAGTLAGDSAEVAGIIGASEIVGYSFGVSQQTFDPFGTPNRIVTSELNRLTLEFATDAALSEMLSLAASGDFFSSVAGTSEHATLWGLTEDASGKAIIGFSLALSDFIVTQVTDHSGAGFSVDLDLVAFQLSQSRRNPVTGVISDPAKGSTFGWNDVTDTTTTVVPLITGTVAPTGLADQFYMAMDGVFGDLTGTDRGGWLALDAMSFSIQNTSEAGVSDPTLAAAETGTFTVTLTSDRALARMMEALATGTAISAVEIQGTKDLVINAELKETTVQSYVMNEVYVTSINDADGPGFSVTFEIARWSHQSFGLDGEGELVSTTLQARDFETGLPVASLTGVNLTGNATQDTLAGSSGSNILDGGAGNDLILGFGGTDTLRGGTGDDTLQGGTSADLLEGGDNADLLRGENGSDTLTGGLGADRFVFSTLDIGNTDIITDFNRSQSDKIDLRDLSPDVLGFVTGAFTAIGQVRVVAVDGTTSRVQVNLSGDSVPELFITLQNNSTPALFTASDFLL